MHPANARQNGYALLIVLWTMVLLALLAAQVTGGGRAELQMAAANRLAAQLQGAADGAIYETIWHMLDGDGDYWPPGSSTFTLKEQGALVQVEVEDDRGKMDVNQVPASMLTGLFAVLGYDNDTATNLANSIAEWHNQAGPGDPIGNVPPEYRMDGRMWGPPGQDLDRLDELLLVRGITPDIYQRVLPYLTLSLEQSPWLQYAGPVVTAAMNKAKRSAGLAIDAADTRGPTVMRMVATATGPGGARFVRRVMMRLDGTLSGPAWKYRIFSWEQG